MTQVTIKMVQILQGQTGSSTLNCTRALTETNGDFDKAIKWLKDKGLI